MSRHRLFSHSPFTDEKQIGFLTIFDVITTRPRRLDDDDDDDAGGKVLDQGPPHTARALIKPFGPENPSKNAF